MRAKYELYESTQKSSENLYGIKEIKEKINPFLEGPCFLCIAARIFDKKNIFGVTKQLKNMARIRVRGQRNAGFNIDEVPVKFLTLYYEVYEDFKYLSEEFVKDNFVPLISKNGRKIDITQAMRNVRNINIMTYCDGTRYAKMMEDCLIKEMEVLEYSAEEIREIVSQICVFPFATFRIQGNEKATYIGFKDINDDKISSDLNEEIKERVKASTIGEYMYKYSDNVYEYLYNGNGEHFRSLPKYSKDGVALPVCVSSIISNAIENSINNFVNDTQFVPVGIKTLAKGISNITKQAKDGKTKQELMKKLDEKISYGNSRKMEQEEAQILDDIDIVCDKIIKYNVNSKEQTDEEKARALEEKIELSKKLTNLISAIQVKRKEVRNEEIK